MVHENFFCFLSIEVRAEDMLHSLPSPIKRNIARDPYDNVNDNDDDGL